MSSLQPWWSESFLCLCQKPLLEGYTPLVDIVPGMPGPWDVLMSLPGPLQVLMAPSACLPSISQLLGLSQGLTQV